MGRHVAGSQAMNRIRPYNDAVVGRTTRGWRGTTSSNQGHELLPAQRDTAWLMCTRAPALIVTNVRVVRGVALVFSMLLVIAAGASSAEATTLHRGSPVAPHAPSLSPSASRADAARRHQIVPPTSGSNWPAYLFGATHGSDNVSATAITTSNASSLRAVWSYIPTGRKPLGNVIYSSPIVYGGQVYVGSQNGTFYDLNETTGAVVWRHYAGVQPQTTCGVVTGRGFVSTATVASSPATGRTTVYVTAPNGFMYAWNASNGRLEWRSVVAIPSKNQNDYFNWSSPTVANGRIYVGVSSNCDHPLVQGGERVYDQASGQLLATFDTTPPNDAGGSIWSSALVASDGSVYVTTGNQTSQGGAPGYSQSIVRLDPNTLQVDNYWTLPENQQASDGDFGGSATGWTANLPSGPTAMVGACNKNGTYYALNASDLAAGPVWQDPIDEYLGGVGICLAAAVWDQAGGRLLLSGSNATINGTSYGGSVQDTNPATGAAIWQTGLPAAVMGTPTLDGAGVLAVPTMPRQAGETSAVYLLNESNGQVLYTINTGNTPVFAQPVFADNYVFVATAGGGVTAYEPTAG